MSRSHRGRSSFCIKGQDTAHVKVITVNEVHHEAGIYPVKEWIGTNILPAT